MRIGAEDSSLFLFQERRNARRWIRSQRIPGSWSNRLASPLKGVIDDRTPLEEETWLPVKKLCWAAMSHLLPLLLFKNEREWGRRLEEFHGQLSELFHLQWWWSKVSQAVMTCSSTLIHHWREETTIRWRHVPRLVLHASSVVSSFLIGECANGWSPRS